MTTGTSTLDRLVAATLYEGYLLYPYRATSVKNKVRWTFGGVHPRAYSEGSGGTERWETRTECLLEVGDGSAEVLVRVRFLQPMARTVGVLEPPAGQLDAAAEARLLEVNELSVGDAVHRSFDEAVERTVEGGLVDAAADASVGALTLRHTLPAGREVEPLHDDAGRVVGALVRTTEELVVEVETRVEPAGPHLRRVAVVIRNLTDLPAEDAGHRDRAVRRSLVSTHAILTVEGGGWLSLADPPEEAVEAAAACRNEGLWPVLVGDPRVTDTILASPIILEDHAHVAPESAGDLFDATEIDEILSLRILALSDAEKEEMRGVDPRSRALLERTEALTAEQWLRLHGVVRDPVEEGRE